MNKSDAREKELLSNYLKYKRGHTVIIPDDPYCRYDVESWKDGKRYVWEIKSRTCDSKKYGDTIIESGKLAALLEEHCTAYVVNIFTDGVTTVADISETPYELQNRYCQKTAWWGGGKKSKILVSFKNEDCMKIDLY